MRIFISTMICILFLNSCSEVSLGPSKKDILKLNPQLLEVLQRFEGDSLKYKAAEFLIENLPYHYSYEGEELDKYLELYALHGTGKFYPQPVYDSIMRKYGYINIASLQMVSDTSIDPDYLIENIEWAFKVWQEQPWGKNVSFENFCEYILPYRVGNERLSSWREEIYNKYNPMLDSIRSLPEAEDPLFVSQVLLDSLSKGPINFTELFAFGPHEGPKVVEWRSGSCVEFTHLQLYVFRALGLPCGEDKMIMRGDGNVPHCFNSVFDKNGVSYFCSLLYPGAKIEETNTYWNPKGKVYRNTFSLNRKMIKEIGKKPDAVYPTFRWPCMVDVTSVYAGVKNRNPEIPAEKMYHSLKKGEVVYLCSSSCMKWAPIAWGRYEKKRVRFDDVEGGVVFRLATYQKGELTIQSDPFFVDRETGGIRYISPSDKEEEVCLLHKYNLFYEPFIKRMLGGVFEGSNDAGFRQKDTLFVITKEPVRLHNVALTRPNDRKYRYVRYVGPPDGHCNVSEITFYESRVDSISLKGKVIGTPGPDMYDGTHEYTNAFDGDPYTSYHYHLPTGGWAGLDLGKSYSIGKIIFTPRNRDNFIRKGDRYELFYVDGADWHSAGIVVSGSDSLLYKVPEEALLYLRNHTRGKDERIFEYKDGKQLFL